MPTLTLTQAAVDRLRAPTTGRVEYWDSQLPGFGLPIAAPRRGKDEETARRTWQALYRMGGKLVRETIGTMAKIPNVADVRALASTSMQKAQPGAPGRGETTQPRGRATSS